MLSDGSKNRCQVLYRYFCFGVPESKNVIFGMSVSLVCAVLYSPNAWIDLNQIWCMYFDHISGLCVYQIQAITILIEFCSSVTSKDSNKRYIYIYIVANYSMMLKVIVDNVINDVF